MSKIGLAHILMGFWLILLASFGGFFLADYRTESYLRQAPMETLAWWMVLQKSAHAHTNLFGMLHILTGLTLPYSLAPRRWKWWQFLGLLMGSLAMSVLLVIRSFSVPNPIIDPLGWLIALFLTLACGSIVIHLVGLTRRWQRMTKV